MKEKKVIFGVLYAWFFSRGCNFRECSKIFFARELIFANADAQQIIMKTIKNFCVALIFAKINSSRKKPRIQYVAIFCVANFPLLIKIYLNSTDPTFNASARIPQKKSDQLIHATTSVRRIQHQYLFKNVSCEFTFNNINFNH